MGNKKVQILLSVYRPNEEYLIKQLKSLNEQDYENLELLIFDDGASIEPCDVNIFKNNITNFPYRILPYAEKNLRYVKAFETLIKASDADYIAFCDQDDIWRKDKISKCVEELENEGSLLVASDRTLIDGEDNIICESVRKSSNKNYESWQSGDDICKNNLVITYAVGMCLVGKGNFIRSCLPLSKNTGHDKWIISCAATEGKVSFINDTLVQYRRHGNNVSGVLVGINTKEDYVNNRVLPLERLTKDFFVKYPNHKDRKEIEAFVKARKTHDLFSLIKYKDFAPDIVKFEIALCIVPNFAFGMLLKIARKIS